MKQCCYNLFNKGILLFCVWLATAKDTGAQTCISSFPYVETFESSDGNWKSGGIGNDWAWGTPSKPVIKNAASGTKCWVTGGLTGSSYSNSQSSFLQSPCFDFSNLKFPQISFSVFWEIEKNFDGASLQYSTTGGSSWAYLGSTGSNSDCQGENWFNNASIKYLINAEGWSGNIQGNNGSCVGGGGSNGWLTARHTLNMLAGKPNVMFRFVFASGSTCNDFDGFAIDDIRIEETPENTGAFTGNCVSASQVNFNGPTKCVASWSWDFGDTAAGVANKSAIASPSHNFSGPGTYTVTLTTRFASGPPVVSTKTIVIIGLTTREDWPGRCVNIYDGTFSVLATGSNTPYAYLWNTVPEQTTASVRNLQPGNYTVKVSSENACDASVDFIIKDSAAIQLSVKVKNASCEGKDGSITTIVSGGTPPFKYLWSNGSTQPDLINIDSGYYDVDVTDAANCFSKTFPILVDIDRTAVAVNLGEDFVICPGESIILDAGSFAAYEWQDGSTKQTYTVTSPGIYSVIVTNGKGCTGTGTVQAKLDCSKIFFPAAFSPNGDGINDLFGVLGNLEGLKNFSIAVYNRFGQVLFKTNDPYKKWDGKINGKLANMGAYIWMANYYFRGKQQSAKGMITVIH